MGQFGQHQPEGKCFGHSRSSNMWGSISHSQTSHVLACSLVRSLSLSLLAPFSSNRSSWGPSCWFEYSQDADLL